MCVGVLLRDVVHQNSDVSLPSSTLTHPPSLHPQCGLLVPPIPPPPPPPPPSLRPHGKQAVAMVAAGCAWVCARRYGNRSKLGYQVPPRLPVRSKRIPTHRQQKAAGGINVNLLLTNLFSLFSPDLQQQSSQENKDVVSTVDLPLASRTRLRNVSARRGRRDLIDL